jgi:hypothetical protein
MNCLIIEIKLVKLYVLKTILKKMSNFLNGWSIIITELICIKFIINFLRVIDNLPALKNFTYNIQNDDDTITEQIIPEVGFPIGYANVL